MGKLITKEDHRDALDKAMEQDGPFTHNICSLVLRSADEKFGRRYANGLIEEYQLDIIFGIQKVKGDKR